MNNKKIGMDIIGSKLAIIIDYLNNNYQSIHKEALENLLIESKCKDFYSENLMLSDFHTIDCIGKNRLPNATFISKELNMTKGAISKITSKLIKKDLIKGDKLENNKREIYYSLTVRGRKLFEIHERFHKAEDERLLQIFSRYDNEEINVINNFLDDLIKVIRKQEI